MTTGQNGSWFAYVGTYTTRGSKGIYVFRYDPASGGLTLQSTASEDQNPSFVAISPDRRFLYSVNEVQDYEGNSSGAVSAYAVDEKTGGLTFLNRKATKGPGPCHLMVDPTGKFVVAANYSGGSVALFPVNADGSVDDASDFIQHQGSSINENRQKGPHAHSANLSPDGTRIYVADLGLDKILIYQIDATSKKLRPNNPAEVVVHAGAGPRHFKFHPNRKFAYVINELDSTVTAFAVDASNGGLAEIETLSTIPSDFHERTHTADLHITASGKYLYGSNRGHDSLAIFKIDQSTGRLTAIGHESTQGQTPRNFAIDPTGRFVFAENQNGDTIVTFTLDDTTGKLTPTGTVMEVPAPVCLIFVPLAG